MPRYGTPRGQRGRAGRRRDTMLLRSGKYLDEAPAKPSPPSTTSTATRTPARVRGPELVQEGARASIRKEHVVSRESEIHVRGDDGNRVENNDQDVEVPETQLPDRDSGESTPALESLESTKASEAEMSPSMMMPRPRPTLRRITRSVKRVEPKVESQSLGEVNSQVAPPYRPELEDAPKRTLPQATQRQKPPDEMADSQDLDEEMSLFPSPEQQINSEIEAIIDKEDSMGMRMSHIAPLGQQREVDERGSFEEDVDMDLDTSQMAQSSKQHHQPGCEQVAGKAREMDVDVTSPEREKQLEAQISEMVPENEETDMVDDSLFFDPPEDPDLQYAVSCNLYRLKDVDKLMGEDGWLEAMLKKCPQSYLGRELWMYLRFLMRNLSKIAPQQTSIEDQSRWFLEKKETLQKAFDGVRTAIDQIVHGAPVGDEALNFQVALIRHSEIHEFYIPTCVGILRAVVAMSPAETDLSMSMEPKGPKLKYSMTTLDILIRASGWILRLNAAAEESDDELLRCVTAFRKDVKGALNAIVRVRSKREGPEVVSADGTERDSTNGPDREDSAGSPEGEEDGSDSEVLDLRNAGQVWTPVDDAFIITGLDMGESMANLAASLGRTEQETRMRIDEVVRPEVRSTYTRLRLAIPAWAR